MEYQSYHFLAVDRHLSPGEMAELRRYSTRAHISSTEFKNFYTFGWYGFKGDVGLFLERYFDVFVYWANWGNAEIAIRVPAELITTEEADQYRSDGKSFIEYRADSAFMSFSSNSAGDPPEEPDSSGTIMASAVAARQSLLNGDRRLLYLGWLLQVQSGKPKMRETEPAVPPGLGELDGCLLDICDFLGIDIDLRQAAALTSAKLYRLDSFDPRDWIRDLPAEQKDEILARLAEGDTRAASEWQRQWRREINQRQNEVNIPKQRRVSELLKTAEKFQATRTAKEDELTRLQNLRAQRRAAQQEEARIWKLVGREQELWNKTNEILASKSAHRNKEAVKLLCDLKALHDRWPTEQFPEKLAECRQRYANRPTLLAAIKQAAL